MSTSDRRGGAEGVALGLRDGYAQAGHGSWLAVGYPSRNDPAVLTLSPERQRVRSMWDRSRGREEFRFPATRTLLDLPPTRPDVVHAHNLHGWYFDLRELIRLSHEVQLHVTMHDNWLLTGHCAHSFTCERWRSGCGSCPDLGIYPAISRDATARNWNTKREIYRQSHLHVAAPSQWLLSRMEESMLTAASSRVIRNGVDLATFCPADRRAARGALDLPQERPILLFAAAGIVDNPWKDWPTLKAAFQQLVDVWPDPSVPLLVGLGDDPEIASDNPNIRLLPFVSDPDAVARVYHAADIYVHAARADTFPTTVLEALACGLPVVATAVGGIPEQVKTSGPDATGVLVPPADPRALASAITSLLSDPVRRTSVGEAAANSARAEFDMQMTTAAYLRWFEETRC